MSLITSEDKSPLTDLTHAEAVERYLRPFFTGTIQFLPLLDEALKREGDIPSFPASVKKLEVLLGQDPAIEDLAMLVQQDVGLAAKFLRIANSPVFRGTTKISSVHDALLRIGLAEVKRVVVSEAFVTSFSKLRISIDWKLFWTHSLLTARLAERVCDIFTPPHPSHYLSGLLHDVGKLTLQSLFPDKFVQVVEQVRLTGQPMFEVEYDILGISHAEVGAYHGSRWGLEPNVIEAILYHHHAEDASEFAFEAACISVADVLANGCNENIASPDKHQDVADLNHIPTWAWLSEKPKRRAPYIPLLAELNVARHAAEALLGT